MQSSIGHIQLNIKAENKDFYKELFEFLGWNTIFEDEATAGFVGANGESIWVIGSEAKFSQNYDDLGVNHIGIAVEKQSNVDETLKFLGSKKVESLFETPRHRPEFATSNEETYYQVMFESPDKILFEVVYTGLKE